MYLLPHRIILLLPSSIYECTTPLATAIRVVLLPPSNRIIVAPSIVSVPVVFVADVIIDAGVYYLLQASTLHLLLLLYYYYYYYCYFVVDALLLSPRLVVVTVVVVVHL